MELVRIFNGKKFMWNGEVYQEEKECREVAQKYSAEGFEVEVVQEGEEYFLFTRRVVKEVVTEGIAGV